MLKLEKTKNLKITFLFAQNAKRSSALYWYDLATAATTDIEIHKNQSMEFLHRSDDCQ